MWMDGREGGRHGRASDGLTIARTVPKVFVDRVAVMVSMATMSAPVRVQGKDGKRRLTITSARASGLVARTSGRANVACRGVGDGKTAIVVGGGVGGLGMASRLANEGFDVTVLEKREDVGGRCRSEEFAGGGEGYRFDTGPSLLLLPDRYREQFESVGEKMEDYLDIERVDPAYRAHFGDHSTLDLLYDIEAMRKQLDDVEFGAGGKYIDWLGRARASLDYGVAAFIERDANSILDFVDLSRVGPLALAVNPVDLLLPQFNQMAKYFKDERLRALFSYQELYVGLSPYNAPGVFSLLAATELTDGVWYPKGGFTKVRESLNALADKKGAKVKLGSEVSEILTEEVSGLAESKGGSHTGRKVIGVRLASGEVMNADVVVANPDLPCVWDQMLDSVGEPAKKESEKWDDAEYSCSVIEFNWCLNKKLPDLLHHNVFLSSDYKGSWDPRPSTVDDFAAPRQHNFYCHNPVYTDETCAPEGGSSIMILLPVANIREQEKNCKKRGVPVPTEEEMVAAGREAILRRFKEAGHGDLSEMIVHESVTTPTEWREKFNIKHGAVFGLSHGLLQLAAFRPPVRTGIKQLDSPVVDGLHFVGASTRPGNGVPLVLMGVKVVAEAIMKEQSMA
jgi:phytoene desaturase (3,4-didehydrolycopene-forming)